jgi:hypothetical protein
MSNIFIDPILSAIREANARWDAYKSTCDRGPGGPWGTPEYNVWHGEEIPRWRRMGEGVSGYAHNAADNARGCTGID